MGRARRNARLMKTLQRLGPHFGHYPEPAKSWHVCLPEEEQAAREAFEAEGVPMQFTAGHRYLGGFHGSEGPLEEWVVPKVEGWVDGVRALARVADRYPQTAYAGLAMSLQHEWQYLQRVIPEVGAFMDPIEEAIREEFLPALFGGDLTVDDDLRELLALGVKRAGLGLPVPTA